jgi:hypothetical protein
VKKGHKDGFSHFVADAAFVAFVAGIELPARRMRLMVDPLTDSRWTAASSYLYG